MQGDNLGVFPISLFVVPPGRSQTLTEIHAKQLERAPQSGGPTAVHAENHYGLPCGG